MKDRQRWWPVLLWIGLILFLSTRELSFFVDTRAEKTGALVEMLQYPVHFFLYLVLYLFMALALLDSPGGRKRPRLSAVAKPLALTLVVAVLDEVVQSFVPSRTFAFRDLFSDAAGALLGVVLVKGRGSVLFSLPGRWGLSSGSQNR